MTRADVIIVGGGPAGAATATFLADAGHSVHILERERFPRFHIGESLLPMALTVLERLGVDLGGGGHQFKAGARFLDEETGQEQTYLFEDGLPGAPRHAYHVERAEFDRALLDRARQAGATVSEGTSVTGVQIEDDGVTLRSSDGTHEARYLVDASGQAAFLARRDKTLRPLHSFGRAAAFCHYEGLSDAAWDEIQPEGNIEILRVGGGWAWAIPLVGRRLSVGVVAREGKMSPQDVFSLVASSMLLRRWTEGAARMQPHLVGDYSFRNEAPHGARYVCVGDSACFLDPVFSSGVTIGLLAAARAADLLSAALRAEAEADPGLMTGLSRMLAPAYRGFYSLIHRFYNTAILDNLFFAEHPEPIYRSGLITMLAGDVWRDDNPFQNMIMASTRHAEAAGFT